MESQWKSRKTHVELKLRPAEWGVVFLELARAFLGEFVPIEVELASKKGCSYNPAFILLERIRERGDR